MRPSLILILFVSSIDNDTSFPLFEGGRTGEDGGLHLRSRVLLEILEGGGATGGGDGVSRSYWGDGGSVFFSIFEPETE